MPRRRGPGEGSIRRRADGRIEARYTVYDAQGRSGTKSIYARKGEKQRDLQRRLRKAIRDQEAGLEPTSERLTLAKFLSGWLDRVTPSLRPKTAEEYRKIVEKSIVPALGRTSLTRLQPEHVQAYINDLAAQGLRPNTVRNRRATLRRALNDAYRSGAVSRNVATMVTLPRSDHQEIQPLSSAETAHFIEYTAEHRLSALFTLACTLGLRQGELLALSWDDIDFPQRRLHVRRSLQRTDAGEFILVEPKTARSRRVIGLADELVDDLRRHQTRQKEERLRAGPMWTGNAPGLIFTTETGDPIIGETLTGQFQTLLSEAGLPRKRFHDLRHGAASILLDRGYSLKVVQQILGHATITVTADTYAHLSDELQREAVASVSAALRTPNGSTNGSIAKGRDP